MVAYLARRVLLTMPLLVFILIFMFFLMHMIPGDPVVRVIGGRPASRLVMDNLRHQMGLDLPLHRQFLLYFSNIFTKGDFGTSFMDRRPVLKKYLEAFPHSVQLAVGSIVVAVVLGFSLGTIAGVFSDTWLDTGVMVFAVTGVSLPGFVLGLLLIYIFCLNLHWLPVLGEGFVGLILPSISAGLWAAGNIARLTRSSILEVMNEDYIRTARAKGLGTMRVVTAHALRNAIIPAVTFAGIELGVSLAGLPITETVFNRQGIGRLLVDAVIDIDYPVVQFGILFITTLILFMNLLVDIVYSVIDPRIAYD